MFSILNIPVDKANHLLRFRWPIVFIHQAFCHYSSTNASGSHPFPHV